VDLIETLLSARVLDLSQPFDSMLSTRPGNIAFKMALAKRHGDAVAPNGTSAALELLTMSSHSGTHVDALSHISHDGRLFGGVDASEAQRGGTFSELGIETLAPLVYRGILLDVAAALGVERLGPAQAVDADTLERCRAAQGTGLPAGAALLIRTGWGERRYYYTQDYLGIPHGVPGVDESAADWIIDRGVAVTGADTTLYERVGPDGTGLPVHKMLLVDAGIHILENLYLDVLAERHVYEFGFVVAPMNIPGASGAPARPIALY
jgi:kynurenine formamidase